MDLSIDHHQVIYDENVIYYQLRYVADRKNKVAIHVQPNGSVQVEAPLHTSLADVKQAILKQARWILDHLNKIKEHHYHILPREYISGETHFYLGKRHKLKVVEEQQDLVKLAKGQIIISTHDTSLAHVREIFKQWYRSRCNIVFQSRIETIAGALKWTQDCVPEWKLLSMKKQWGSCSPKGKIVINPHLIKAPIECIDYVLLHELCHLREHNHSKNFYKLLDTYMSDWSFRKDKLDRMAELLLNE